MSRDDILSALQRLREEIADEYKADIEGIFGSYARGDERPESDLDLLVTFRKDANVLDWVGLAQFLEQTLHCKVDVVSTRALREEIRPAVMRDLVRL